MKRKDITILNIGDYIRQEKRKGFEKNKPRVRMFWNKKEWKILSQLVYIFGYGLKDGSLYMGIKHFTR